MREKKIVLTWGKKRGERGTKGRKKSSEGQKGEKKGSSIEV
jgi:hypothetical protein